MTPYTVIGGYLGAGKTTLVNQLLQNAEGRRIALLINDFGEINIDAELISSQTDKQINLTNGCVCCTLSDGYGEALDTLLEMEPKPDQIVVEASGVANVHSLAQYGYGHELQLDAVIVLADAETVKHKANDKYVAQTVRRQLAAADLILLNKCDLLNIEQLKTVKTWLTNEFGRVPIIETCYARIPPAVLSSIEPEQRLEESVSHEHYSTCTIRWAEPVSEQALRTFIDQLPDNVLRAKGFASLKDGRTMLIQVVGKRRELTISPQAMRGMKSVFIGLEQQLDAELIERSADQLFKASV